MKILENILSLERVSVSKRKRTILFLKNKFKNVYELVDLKDRRRYEELVNSADDEVVEVTEEVISEMTNSFGAYDKRIHLALLDHINLV